MRKVLIVDDDGKLAGLLEAFLKRRGWSVAKALSAGQGLALAKAAPPDVILCDVSLPDMDGFAFCRAVRSGPGRKDLPLVYISGSRKAAEDAVAGLDGGGDGYLLKPVDLKLVEAKLNAVVNAVESARSGSRDGRA